MALKIADLSHWNGSVSWKNTGLDAVIIKCSQSTGYVDPMFSANKVGARRAGILCGFYHFAGGNDPIKEADFFVKSVGDIQPGELLALDYEIHIANPVQWCKIFLDEVQRKVGFKPLLYINSSTAQSFDWTPVIKGDYGLWIASYGLNLPVVGLIPPKIGKWPFYAIWQYTSRGKVNGINGYVDLDYCKCSIETLKKYGK